MGTTVKVNTLKDLHTLKLMLKKRVDPIEVSKAGGYFRARFRGCANSVLNSTPEGARRRLLSTPAKRWGIAHAHITTIDKLLRRGLGK